MAREAGDATIQHLTQCSPPARFPFSRLGTASPLSHSKPTWSRVSLVLRTFLALPMVLVLTIIFLELVLGFWLLSDWFNERGWSALGTAATIVWILLAALTLLLTVCVTVAWVVHLFRVMRGREV